MSVRDMQVSSDRLTSLETAVVDSMSAAVNNLASAIAVLIEIKTSGAWRDRLVVDDTGQLVPVHTDFARHYLPWFAEHYADQIGRLSASTLRQRIRWVENCLRLGWSVEQAMRVSLADQFAVEEIVRFSGPTLELKLDPDADPDDALAVVRDVINGDATASTLRSEYGVQNPPAYVLAGDTVFARWPGGETRVLVISGLPQEIVYDLSRRLRIRTEE